MVAHPEPQVIARRQRQRVLSPSRRVLVARASSAAQSLAVGLILIGPSWSQLLVLAFMPRLVSLHLAYIVAALIDARPGIATIPRAGRRRQRLRLQITSRLWLARDFPQRLPLSKLGFVVAS